MHGDRCTRIHNKPMISQTIMFKHLYQNPPAAIAFAQGSKVNEKDLKDAIKHLEKFYEELFIELSNYGELRDLYIVDNLGDHLIGNVYARFSDEIAASRAFNALAGKSYHSNLVEEEYCPVARIKEARCVKFEEGICQRGAMCNFLHLKQINRALIKSLKDEMYEKHPEYRRNRFNRRRQRRHEHSSSDSSLGRYDNISRKKIIKRWNVEYELGKKLEQKNSKIDKTKIDISILEKKLRNLKNYEEDEKINDYYRTYRRKRNERNDDSDETISKEDL